MTDGGYEENSSSGSEPTIPAPPFVQAVGFLLSQLGLVVARQFRQAIESTGLDPREFALLRAIAEADGATQNAMSDQLGIPASSLVTLIDHLEAGGFLVRRTHPLDRRSRTLHATAEGRELLARSMRLAMDYERHLCRKLAPEERTVLLELLDRIRAGLEITPGVHPGMSIDHDAPHRNGSPSDS